MIKKRNKAEEWQRLLIEMCVKSVKVVPTHEAHRQTHTHTARTRTIRVIHFEYATDKFYNSEFFFLRNIVYGFEIKQRDTENNLHIMTCDCSSMTRYLCVVRSCSFFFIVFCRTSVSNTRETGTTQWILMISTIFFFALCFLSHSNCSSLFFSLHEWIELRKFSLK